MSFRRFLHLVANDYGGGSYYSLRRIDASRLFFWPAWEQAQPQSKPLDSSNVPGAVDLLALPDSDHLPDPAMTFASPLRSDPKGFIDFTLFRNSSGDGEHDKVVTMDHTGCTRIWDTGMPDNVLQLPTLAKPKFSPACLTVGGGLFVIEALPSSTRSFQALFLKDGDGLKPTDWYWDTLPPPPFVYDPCSDSHLVKSYTLASGSNILISNKGAQTYCFNTVEGMWSKPGNWALPFCRLAEYVPEHRLWFGISSANNGYYFCAANLTGTMGELMPPVIHGLWQEYMTPPNGWNLIRSFAVYMGFSKFCIVRLFEVVSWHICPYSHQQYESTQGLQALFTGVEVKSCGQALHVVRHKSERHTLDCSFNYRVLQ